MGYENPFREYERRKKNLLRQNPNLTDLQYVALISKVTQELKI
jgi:hypothetical protein